jgi:hypothetical protein
MLENKTGVQNGNPIGGEPEIFYATSEGGYHGERYTGALVSMLTSTTGTEMLTKIRK